MTAATSRPPRARAKLSVVAPLVPSRVRLAEAERGLARAITEMIDARFADLSSGTDWVHQDRSPLGKRKHLELCKRGELAGHKVGRDVYVQRSEIDAYIAGRASHRLGGMEEAPAEETVEERMARRLGVTPES